MNRDDIIRMAREAEEYASEQTDNISEWWPIRDERFAALVEAAVQERVAINSIHTCHSECQRPICVLVREAVEAEREACAQIAFNATTYIEAAKAIRARGR